MGLKSTPSPPLAVNLAYFHQSVHNPAPQKNVVIPYMEEQHREELRPENLYSSSRVMEFQNLMTR